MGQRKVGKINHLLKLMEQKGLSYNVKEIQELSVNQLRKRIEELCTVSQNRKNCFESRGRIVETNT